MSDYALEAALVKRLAQDPGNLPMLRRAYPMGRSIPMHDEPVEDSGTVVPDPNYFIGDAA